MNTDTANQPRAKLSIAALICIGILTDALVLSKPHWQWSQSAIVRYNTVCTILGTAAFSEALFFSLRWLFIAKKGRASYGLIALCAAVALLSMFLSSYYGYVFIRNRLDNIDYEQIDIAGRFPDLVEKMKAAEKAQNQELIARIAYQIYGIQMSYHQSGVALYYQPPADMRKLREQIFAMDTSIRNLKFVSRGLLYRSNDVVLVGFLSLVVCILWTLFWLPRDEPPGRISD